MSISQTIRDIVEICVQQGTRQLVMSPGSRNAPLSLAFNRHPEITSWLIGDERAAGYIGIGISQALKQPVVLLSTSGTAALNYGPAIAEAFYQQVPLIVFTADRPPEWIDQNDGQAIRQRDVFRNHTKKDFELPVSLDHKDAQWHALRIINEAVVTCQNGIPGPVHINAPFREPLFPDTNQVWNYRKNVPLVNLRGSKKSLPEEHWMELSKQWTSASRILIVGGQGTMSHHLTSALDHMQHLSVPVVGDAVSNLHKVAGVINHPEILLTQGDNVLNKLKPDLLITFGGGLISKSLKLFLRKFPASTHWQVQPSGFPADTFQKLSEIIPMEPADFFKRFKDRISQSKDNDWYQEWQAQERQARSWWKNFVNKQNFNEIQAVGKILGAASNKHLHLANSTPVRWVDLFGVDPETIEVSANRGTSGIDGCSSVALGHSLVHQNQNLLISGDMAFFYDRNAFWHQYKVPNLKIVVLNNHGGGIFRLIDGPRQQPELEELFVTKQELSAKNTAKDYGMKYLYCNNSEDLDIKLIELFKPNDQISLLEIEFRGNMENIYQELKSSIKNSYE